VPKRTAKECLPDSGYSRVVRPTLAVAAAAATVGLLPIVLYAGFEFDIINPLHISIPEKALNDLSGRIATTGPPDRKTMAGFHLAWLGLGVAGDYRATCRLHDIWRERVRHLRLADAPPVSETAGRPVSSPSAPP